MNEPSTVINFGTGTLSIPAACLCPACQSAKATNWGEDGSHAIYSCSECGSVFFARPTNNEQDYSDYYAYLRGFDAAKAKQELNSRGRQNRAKLEIINKFTNGNKGRLLDVGAGPGYFAAAATTDGFIVDLVEVNEDAIGYGMKNFGASYIDFEKCTDTYDVITLFHVLEHLEDPIEMLRKLTQRLNPDGFIYVHVPSIETTSARLMLSLARMLRRRPIARRGSLYFPDHLTGFSFSGLAACARLSGLAPARMAPVTIFGPEYDPVIFELGPSKLKYLIYLINQYCRGVIDILTNEGEWTSAVFKRSSPFQHKPLV